MRFIALVVCCCFSCLNIVQADPAPPPGTELPSSPWATVWVMPKPVQDKSVLEYSRGTPRHRRRPVRAHDCRQSNNYTYNYTVNYWYR